MLVQDSAQWIILGSWLSSRLRETWERFSCFTSTTFTSKRGKVLPCVISSNPRYPWMAPCLVAGTPVSQSRSWKEAWSPKISRLTRVYVYTLGFGLCQMAYAHSAADGEYLFLFTWDPRPWCISLTSGGTRDWVARVNHALCLPAWLIQKKNPQKNKTLDPRFRWASRLYLSHIVAGRIKNCPCSSTGKGQLEAHPCFFLDSSLHPFFSLWWFQSVSFLCNKV